MIAWVVGGGGLLGSAVQSRYENTFIPTKVPWHDSAAAVATLQADTKRFAAEAGTQAWRVIWTAGAATVSTSSDQTRNELDALQALLNSLRGETPAGDGGFFLTSSAGGVYAGSVDPPFTSESVPATLSPYGELKLAQERLATKLLADVCPLVIGRLSNLYGPGQNLAKLQGLISRLALSAVTQQPINIFVSLDTIRDYIYVDDASSAVHASIIKTSDIPAETLVIASGQPATVGLLIRTMNQIAKRRVPVALGDHASAASQALDLRLIPSHEATGGTPLPVGMKAVYLDILRRVQHATIPA